MRRMPGILPYLSRQAPGGPPSSFCPPYRAFFLAAPLGPKHHATQFSIRPSGPLWIGFRLRQRESPPEWNLHELGPSLSEGISFRGRVVQVCPLLLVL